MTAGGTSMFGQVWDTFSTGGGAGVRPVQIDGLDIFTIVAYFALVMGIGIYSMMGVKTNSEEGYFLAGRFMTWLPVGASLFATNIGSEHYIGLSGSGAEAGIAIGAFELNALFLLPLLGWVFIPVYIASGASTLPEYMTKRYGGHRIRMMLSIVSLVMYIFTKNSVDMYSGALFIQQAIGWNLYVSIALLLIMTVLSTLAGGLAAVIYTDTLQCFIMILGAVVLLILGMIEVGGFEALTYKYHRAISSDTKDILMNGTLPACGLPPRDAWQMLREPSDVEMPWPGFILGQTTSSLWYWCADQMMVQRVLAAKTLSHAQGGCLACGVIKLIPLFAMVLPGMISRVLYPEEIACGTAETCNFYCESPFSCSNIAYPKLVLGVMPTGMRGFIIAVMLSATMSDLSSTFNSASTLFTMDMYKFIRKRASMTELMIVGRVSVVVVVALGVSLVPVIQVASGPQLFVYIQAITNYFSPPIAALYLVAILWKRGNEKGAFWGLTIGFGMGVIWLIMTFIWVYPDCGQEDTRPWVMKDFHYMYYALFIFWVVVIIDVVVSLITEPPEEWKTVRTMFFTRYDRTQREDEIILEDPEDKKPGYVDEAKTVDMDAKEKKSFGRRIFDFACGAEEPDGDAPVLTAQEQMDALAELTVVKQKRSDRNILFFGAAGLMVAGTFQYIFFSIPWYFKLQPLYFDFPGYE